MGQGIALNFGVPSFPPLTDMSGPKHIGNLTVVQEEFQLSNYDNLWSSLNMNPVGIQYGCGIEAPLDDLDAFLGLNGFWM